MQARLIPVVYAKSTTFKPAPWDPLHSMVHWESW